MIQITQNRYELAELVKKRIARKLYSYFNSLTLEDLPEITYTSFDGDLLSYSELIKQRVLRTGFLPLNPESALGTYLVTNHYQGSKFPIILDCITLLTLCDNFWVITNEKTPEKIGDINKLAEGVIAEIVYWITNVNPNISFLNLKSNTLEPFKCSPFLLSGLDKKQRKGIEDTLNYPKQNLRKSVYLLSGEKHAKHSDWMRKEAYNLSFVPLCPYTLFNFSTFKLAFDDTLSKIYLFKTALSIKAEQIWVFSPFEDSKFDLNMLDDDALIELLLIKKLQPDKVIIHKYFGDVGVPKYTNRKVWAITEYEQETSRE